MARISTPGIWLPGPLNTLNSVSPTGQADIAGNPYFMGMNEGKIIVLVPNEAQSAAAPGTTLYDGSYQIVQLDSSATAGLATEGYAAYIRLDSGATQGTYSSTDYVVPTVTTGDKAATLGLQNFFCGIFINPATVGGQPNGPTPGNWTIIFTGAGRANVQYGGTVNGAVGDGVFPNVLTANGTFESTNGASGTVVSTGIATVKPVAASMGVAYYKDPIYRFPN
jgi:hypothetical protein